jgi:hypothetical protein
MARLTFSPTESTRIKTVVWDDTGETPLLIVVFIRGGTYGYENVPQEVYNAIVKAESPGRVFNNLVKNAGFKYNKVQ